MHAFLGGCLRTVNAIPESVGGVADHVHLLTGLRAVHSIADIVKEIKSASTRWIRSELGLRGFEWQIGYGGFSVSASNREAVRRYIETQEEHHRKRTFQEEYREFLERHGIEVDERYLF